MIKDISRNEPTIDLNWGWGILFPHYQTQIRADLCTAKRNSIRMWDIFYIGLKYFKVVRSRTLIDFSGFAANRFMIRRTINDSMDFTSRSLLSCDLYNPPTIVRDENMDRDEIHVTAIGWSDPFTRDPC